MKILLCAATEFEIAPTIEVLKGNAELSKNVTVLITGVGLMPATYELTKAVISEKPDFILQAGLAGCMDENIPLGTTAAVLRETVGDLGVLQNATFNSAFDMGLINPNEHPWENGKLQNPHEELLK